MITDDLSRLPLAQHPVASLVAEDWDAAIVGAGPAGAAAAISLGLRGHRVLLVDRRAFPREKVCGDGLIADAIAALSRLGALEEVQRHGHAAHALSGYSPSGVRVDVAGTFITLPRRVLDTILVRRAIEAGAVFASGDVTGVDSSDPKVVQVTVAGHAAPIRAKIVLLATGADVALPAKLSPLERTAPTGIALRCYVTSKERIDPLVLSYDRAFLPGYAWIFPLGRDQYNVGCGTFFRKAAHVEVNLRDTFAAFIDRFPLARSLMSSASSITPLKGAPLRAGLTGAPPYIAPRVLAIGETIGATYPFTGEGIGKAMETAEIAASFVDRALRTDDLGVLADYPARLQADLSSRYVGYRVAESWLAHAWLTDFLARRARRSPYVRRAVEGLLAERIDPRRVFSLRGIVRSFRN